MNEAFVLEVLEEALRKAGSCVARWQGKVKIEKKQDRSPVTEADRESNQIIHNILKKAFPHYGYLSEEGLSRGLEKTSLFAVDPLDGTKEYVQGRDDFAISIGLMKEGIPWAGGIYVVRREKLYLGGKETGVRCNGHPLFLRASPCEKIAVSRTEYRDKIIARYPLIQARALPVGSIAVKFTLLLENEVQGYISFYPKGIWDLAGGHALVESAGGKVCNFKEEALRYNSNQRLCREGLVAGHPQTIPFLLEAVRQKIEI